MLSNEQYVQPEKGGLTQIEIPKSLEKDTLTYVHEGGGI